MAAFTEKAIKLSFMKLLNDKPINKITVKDIVEDCGINRNTFYYHFDDIPSLLQEVLIDEVNNLLQNQSEINSIYDCLISAIDFALQNKRAMLHIYNSANRELFEQYLNNVTCIAVKKFIEYACAEYSISSSDRDAIIIYYKCLLIGFVIDWLTTGMNYDLRIKIKRICELYDGSMETAFKRASQPQQRSS